MRFRINAAYEFNAPDDPDERKEVYGTTDPEEMLKVDLGNAAEIFFDVLPEVTFGLVGDGDAIKFTAEIGEAK